VLFSRLAKPLFALATLISALTTTHAHAQTADFPNRPITIIVPFAAGTLTDILARILANRLSVALGQPVVAENKAGADGNIGANFLMSAAPNGYTLMVGPTSIGAINVTLHAKTIKYDPQRDFIGITNIATVSNVLVVGPQVPAKNIPELLTILKSKSYSFGSSGAGGSMHLSGEMFKKMSNSDMIHVPYKSSPAVVNDVMGGRVEMMFCNLPICLPLIRSGKLTALGVTSAQRSALLPDVPTISEAGLNGYVVEGWFGLYAPKGTPPDVIAKLNAETTKILKDPEIKAQLLSQGAVTVGDSSEHFEQFAREERARWAKIIEEAKIELE
jgi:tripartite-type tricarboxylate transporter receptor subunit TctC